MRLDPVTLEILGNKVAAATEEMCFTLQRTGRTLYVKETADFACALAGVDGTFFAYPRSIGVSGFVALDCMPAIKAVGALEGVVTLTSIGRIETGSAASQLQAATPAAVFHSAMALRRCRRVA
jgi:N-methylhydantoinase B